MLTGDTLTHIEKRHGGNGAANHSMADSKDIARMGWVISNFDSVVKSGTTPAYSNTNGSMANVILLKKQIINVYNIVIAVPYTKRKSVYIQSAYTSKD